MTNPANHQTERAECPTPHTMELPERRIAALLDDAEAVVIAASNGFDIADGYNQFACDQAFQHTFGHFHHEWGLQCILQGLAAHWPSENARWAFIAQLVEYGFGDYTPSPVMKALDRITAHLPRFVITCNCNGRFERAGFAPDGLAETEGSFAYLCCSNLCSSDVYEALPFAERLTNAAENESVSDSLIPRCPRCGATLEPTLDESGKLLSELNHFRSQNERLARFLEDNRSKRTLVLELGVGQRNRAIKAPLMAYAQSAPYATYVVLNRELALLPPGMGNRAISIQGDLAQALFNIQKEMEA